MKFPKHEASLHLCHNEHKSNYETVLENILYRDDDFYHWVSVEQRQKAIDANDFWYIQWYPDTPVGFHCVAAADLDVLLDYVNEMED